MNGLSIEKRGNSAICTITELSDELKAYIHDELTFICYGTAEAREDEDFFSYENTIREFLEIYSAKTPELKTGMMGELLAHIILKLHFPSLTSVGVMLNKEDHNIRKGFDLIHIDRNNVSIWYGEAKAGAKPANKTSSQKARNLTHTAKRDLIEKLDGSRVKIWQTARTDARLSLLTRQSKTVRTLLTKDQSELSSSQDIKKNAILVSILFHDHTDGVNPAEIEACYTLIDNESSFEELLIISIQKSTQRALELFFEGEASHA